MEHYFDTFMSAWRPWSTQARNTALSTPWSTILIGALVFEVLCFLTTISNCVPCKAKASKFKWLRVCVYFILFSPSSCMTMDQKGPPLIGAASTCKDTTRISCTVAQLACISVGVILSTSSHFSFVAKATFSYLIVDNLEYLMGSLWTRKCSMHFRSLIEPVSIVPEEPIWIVPHVSDKLRIFMITQVRIPQPAREGDKVQHLF